jgi:hypothetical protein
VIFQLLVDFNQVFSIASGLQLIFFSCKTVATGIFPDYGLQSRFLELQVSSNRGFLVASGLQDFFRLQKKDLSYNNIITSVFYCN